MQLAEAKGPAFHAYIRPINRGIQAPEYLLSETTVEHRSITGKSSSTKSAFNAVLPINPSGQQLVDVLWPRLMDSEGPPLSHDPSLRQTSTKGVLLASFLSAEAAQARVTRWRAVKIRTPAWSI